ncbi:cysteine hydrolase family protein [Aspergillus affinis]|uniref:cysteine hydrolase family protein n=1 Tax=Aspergillus affinis TaxID=1070780 RepID=UPI0022FEA2BF|nr:Isochorismatase hydrolase [Aspergillus affinis]KAI9040479.1 Isochorismatase hydrolase [Aspergillus affinis]
MSLSFSLPTALILIDNQYGFNHPTHWGTSRSNPSYEANLESLLTAFRAAIQQSSGDNKNNLEVIHILHSSASPVSPLHADHPDNGIRPYDFAQPAPDGSEPVMWKHVNSSFIGTDLEAHIRSRGIRQIILAGLTTDHCVSTTTRMAANLGVVDHFPEGPITIDAKSGQQDPVPIDHGRIILVADATATFAKAGIDAETIHAVSVASLQEEFAEVMSTADVIKSLEKKP